MAEHDRCVGEVVQTRERDQEDIDSGSLNVTSDRRKRWPEPIFLVLLEYDHRLAPNLRPAREITGLFG